MSHRRFRPLVYPCPGCSSAAQAVNAAEMSCITGVGGDTPALVRAAKSRRPIVALDGCAFACVKHALARNGVRALVCARPAVATGIDIAVSEAETHEKAPA